jgi:hypothetical protein
MEKDTQKPEIELLDDNSNVQKAKAVDAAQAENAVGYKEFLEVANIEASDKEVSLIETGVDLE